MRPSEHSFEAISVAQCEESITSLTASRSNSWQRSGAGPAALATCGVDAQISHLIQLKAFDYLDAPIHRVSAIDAPQVYAKPLEDWQIPNEERIIESALKLFGKSPD